MERKTVEGQSYNTDKCLELDLLISAYLLHLAWFQKTKGIDMRLVICLGENNTF